MKLKDLHKAAALQQRLGVVQHLRDELAAPPPKKAAKAPKDGEAAAPQPKMKRIEVHFGGQLIPTNAEEYKALKALAVAAVDRAIVAIKAELKDLGVEA